MTLIKDLRNEHKTKGDITMILEKLIKKIALTVLLFTATIINAETVNFPANIIYPSSEETTGTFQVYDNEDLIHTEEITIPADADNYLFQYTSTPNSNDEVNSIYSKISIYPNPTTGKFNVTSDNKGLIPNIITKKITIENPTKLYLNYDKNKFKKLEVFNIKGQKVKSNEKLATGSYIIKCFANEDYNNKFKHNSKNSEYKENFENYTATFETTSINTLPKAYELYENIDNVIELENMIQTQFTLINPDGTEYTNQVKLITRNSETGTTLEQDIVSGYPINLFKFGESGLFAINDQDIKYSFQIYNGTEETIADGIALSNARAEAIGDGTNPDNTVYFILHNKYNEEIDGFPGQTDKQHMSILKETNGGNKIKGFKFCSLQNLPNEQLYFYVLDYTLNHPEKTEQELQNGAINYNNRFAYLMSLITTYSGEIPYINPNTREIINPENSLFKIISLQNDQELPTIGQGIIFDDTGTAYSVAILDNDQYKINFTIADFSRYHHFDSNTDLNSNEMAETGAALGNTSYALDIHGGYSKFPQATNFESSDYLPGDKGIMLEGFLGKPGVKKIQSIAKMNYDEENDIYTLSNKNNEYIGIDPSEDDQILIFDGDRQYTNLIQRID